MLVQENKSYSDDYHAIDKRSIANAMQIIFKDGTKTQKVAIEYPIGHKNRRAEGVKVLNEKFARNLSTHYGHSQTSKIIQACHSLEDLKAMDVSSFIDLWL